MLQFKKPGGTSRGILNEKETWILSMYDDTNINKKAWGECAVFRGLSFDDRPDYENKLIEVCKKLPFEKWGILPLLNEWPSIYFGVETLLKDWETGGSRILFKSDFTEKKIGITINGLIWMGGKEEMLSQIKIKLKEGYQCLKMKIGAINFENELEILQTIRKEFTSREIELRVDANGAFSYDESLEKLKQLADLDIHSIEQPIRAGQVHEMAALVEKSPLPIALDEELIGIISIDEKKELLETINPKFIILKPALIGGFDGSNEWIELIEKQGGKWWITSALESNIGLNAIAQFAYTKKNPMAQGLGTGQLYLNNFNSPLKIAAGKLFLDKNNHWDLTLLNQ